MRQLTSPPTLYLFSDASIRAPAAGGGAVFIAGPSMLLVSFPLDRLPEHSTLAEAMAVRKALQLAAIHFPHTRVVSVITDNMGVVEAINGTAHHPDITPVTEGIRSELDIHGVRLSAAWTRGHHDLSSGNGFANGVAHRLSQVGRNGECLSLIVPFSAKWRETVIALNPRLDPRPGEPLVSGRDAARILNLPYATVVELVRGGYLEVDAERGGICERSVERMKTIVAEFLTRNGASDPQERSPLSPR